MTDSPLPLGPLRAAARATERRMRAQRALDAGATAGVVGAVAAGVALAVWKARVVAGELPIDAPLPLGVLIGCAALPALAAAANAARRLPPLAGALALDRAHALSDRIASALTFADRLGRRASAFERAAMADALAHAAVLDPRRAQPLRAPRDAIAALGLSLGVAALALAPVAQPAPPPVARVAPRLPPAALLHADDVAAFREQVRETLARPELGREITDAARGLDRVLADLSDRRLDRAEALRRIEQLRAGLEEGRRATAEEMQASMDRVAAELQRAAQTRAAAEALAQGDAATAAERLAQAAERLREQAPPRAEVERLREALRRAAEARAEAPSPEELQRRREELQRLLQRQREAGAQPQPEQERRLLERRRRELERLEREQQRAEGDRRRLERLQRELDRAAQELGGGDREQASQSMERGAEELNRMARERMSEEERQRLEEQLSALREMIRRQREAQQQQAQNGQGGQQQGAQGGGQGQGQGRMDRFVLQASGRGQPGDAQLRMPGQGQQGQGQQGQGQQGQGQQGQGQQGQGQQGQGQQGQGQQGQAGAGQGAGGQSGGQGGDRVLTMTPSGQGDAMLELPGGGTRPGQGAEGPGEGRPGPGAGTGHDPTMLEDPTRLGGARQATRVDGEQSGRGPTRSEVILGASARGFASRAYRRVFVDYAAHAEEVLEQDRVPGGYRFYVRRYFQLIRPRDEAAPAP